MKVIPNIGLLFLVLIILPGEELSGGSQAEEIPKLQNPFSESYVIENLRKTKPRLIYSAEIVENVRGKVETGAILRQDGKELKLNNLSHGQIKLNVVSLDPPPMELDKKIKGLRRIELRIPVSLKDRNRGSMKIKLRLESSI